MKFPTCYEEILDRINQVNPIHYGRTRNFIDGAVTYLSPYISRGVVSTKQILKHTIDQGYDPNRIEKFIQELAWRDYWQQIWIAKGSLIDQDLKFNQQGVQSLHMPLSILNAQTGIETIDFAIEELNRTGYMHNHLRMYVSSIATHVGKYHWYTPAKWMYYHLLDGDWASNALSWQWVAGTSRQKAYFANQENINKYCHTNQTGTFLDVSYEILGDINQPPILSQSEAILFEDNWPKSSELEFDETKSTLIYNWYNMDPIWHSDLDCNRILLIEPEIFKKYPISDHSFDFLIALGENIPGLQLFTGSFSKLKSLIPASTFIYKEHPLNQHYIGVEEPRDWMFTAKGDFPSFFSFWKKCKKELIK